jgi:hypothetical protein
MPQKSLDSSKKYAMIKAAKEEKRLRYDYIARIEAAAGKGGNRQGADGAARGLELGFIR